MSLWQALILAAALTWTIAGVSIALLIVPAAQFIPLPARMQPRAVDTIAAGPHS